MAETITLKVETDVDDSITTLGKLESELESLKDQIKDVEVGSDAFKELSTKIRNTETEVKNLNKSFEGLDTEALVGEFGKFTGGITSALTGIAVLGGDANESMEAMITTVAKGMAIAQGFRGAAEAAQGATKLWAAAQRILNVVMASNPIGLIIAAVATLVAGIAILIKSTEKLNDEQERSIRTQKSLLSITNEASKNTSDIHKQSVDVQIESLKRLYGEKVKGIELEIRSGEITKVEGAKKLTELKTQYTSEVLLANENRKLKEKIELDYNENRLKLLKTNDDDLTALLIKNAIKQNSDYKGLTLEGYNELNDEAKQQIKNISTFTSEGRQQILDLTNKHNEELLDLETENNEDLFAISAYAWNKRKNIDKEGRIIIKEAIETDNKEIQDKIDTQNQEKLERWKTYYNELEAIKLNAEAEYKSITESEDDEEEWDLEDDPEVIRLLALKEYADKLRLNTIEGQEEAYEYDQSKLDESYDLRYLTLEEYDKLKEDLAIEHAAKIKSIEDKSNKESVDGFTNAAKMKMSMAATMLTSISQLMDIAEDEDELSRKEQKRRDIQQGIINTAAAVLQALASGAPPYSYVMAGISGALGAAQVMKIASTKYEQGGILSGPSHAQGGIQTPYGELEGGEGVINNTSMSNSSLRNLASAANVGGGGKNFSSGDGSIKLSPDSIAMITNGINDKKVIVSETDITETQRKVLVVEQESIL